jgi:hypothetical protein
MKKLFDCLHKNFNSTSSKIKNFCLQNQLETLGVLCFVYVTFLCCITKLAVIINVLLVFGFFYTLVYILDITAFKFQTLMTIVCWARVLTACVENITCPLCVYSMIFLLWVLLYSYFETTSLGLKLEDRSTKTTKARLAFANYISTRFRFFGAVSALASCNFFAFLSFNFIFREVYTSLNSYQQEFVAIFLLSTSFLFVVGSILNLRLLEAFNKETLNTFRHLLKRESLFRILLGTFFFFFLDHLARLPDTSSTFLISKFRIHFGVGYT